MKWTSNHPTLNNCKCTVLKWGDLIYYCEMVKLWAGWMDPICIQGSKRLAYLGYGKPINHWYRLSHGKYELLTDSELHPAISKSAGSENPILSTYVGCLRSLGISGSNGAHVCAHKGPISLLPPAWNRVRPLIAGFEEVVCLVCSSILSSLGCLVGVALL